MSPSRRLEAVNSFGRSAAGIGTISTIWQNYEETVVKGKGRGLLENILVLDLANEQGSFCSKLLADLGASVIKIEGRKGDPSRGSLSFLYHNTNKLGIALDLETREGRQSFRRLVKRADVLIETFRPRYLQAKGMDCARLRCSNPRLIHVSITGFGQTGPKCNYLSCDSVISAFGGQMYISGSTSSPPAKLFGQQTHYTASLFGAVAVLLGLRNRKATGKGSYIDLSAQEAVASVLDHVMVDYFHDGRIVRRQDNSGQNEFTILPCKDGHIQITILRNWETLIELIASEGMAEDLLEKKWRDESHRAKHFGHILEVVATWTQRHTKRKLFELGQSMRFPWAPVDSLPEVLSSPQLKARKFFSQIPLRRGGPVITFSGMPYRFSSYLPPLPKRAPLLGEHTRRVLKELCTLQEDYRTPRKTGKSENPLGGNILKGVRVIDLTRMLSGPYATRIFADFGADVIKIQSEQTAQGAERNDTPYFNTWNRNKRSISLDLNIPEARDIFLRLVAVSDVVVENFSPRVMANWGLTYTRLRRVKPDLVMLSISAMGRTGPWKDFVGYGATFHALSGLISESSRFIERPASLGHAYGDVIIGLYAAIAILSALEHRDRSGEGQFIDLSGYEALCTLLGPALLACSLDPELGGMNWRYDPFSDAAPEGCYRCKGYDRWCVISVDNDRAWQALLRISKQLELRSKRFSTLAKRKRNRAELDALVEQWTVSHTAEAIVHRLQNAGVAAAVVQNAEDVARDLQLVARRFFVSLEHPVLGKTISDRSALWPWQRNPKNWEASPRLGEDNHEVFVKLLGLSEAEFQSLLEKGIAG